MWLDDFVPPYPFAHFMKKGKVPDFAIDKGRGSERILRLAREDRTYLSVHWGKSFYFAQDEKIACVNFKNNR